MKNRVTFILILMTLLCHTLMADWKPELNLFIENSYNLTKTIDVNRLMPDEKTLDKLAKAIHSSDYLLNYINNHKYSTPLQKGKLLLKKMKGKDGIERPWVLYIPDAYFSLQKTPLLVALHGGVSRKDIIENPLEYAKKSSWFALAKKNSWFVIFPMGQAGATWWDEVGMENIKQQIRAVKANFNIDNDKVFMAGFSDGSSAGFLHAMLEPDDYASIVALNGHIGVGSLDGKLPTYAPNIFNTPMYTVTTDNDGLYPTAKMARSIKMAQEAGGDITYRQLRGHHSFDYADTELPIINRFLNKHPRDSMATKIYWETGDLNFGKCKWISIDRIAGFEPPASWHKDFNCVLIDNQVSVGFFPEKATNGLGVGKVVDGSFAAKIGLKTGDAIIKAGGIKITNNDDLDKAKATVKRGDSFPITVLRNNKVIELKGTLSKETYYNVFTREVPSAAIKAEYGGNTVTVEGSRVSAFSIYVHPDMFKLDEKIKVIYNGKVVFNEIIKPDTRFILENYLKNLDSSLLYEAKISIKL